MAEQDPYGEEPRTSLRRASPLPWILVALALVAGGTYLWSRMRPQPAPPPAPAAPAAAPAPVEPEPTPQAAATGEARLPDLLPRVSSDPLVRQGLALEDLIRRTAVVIDNLAEGVSPRRELRFLAPRGEFEAVRRGGGQVISPASYARYDGFAAAVGSVDVPALAAAWKVGRPALQAAYRTLGYPASALDRALARALRRLANAPVRDGDVRVVDEGGVFVFDEDRLEMLQDVEKHLLRMGPRNTRIIQAKARELLTALELPGK
jgi:hypothetical protein